ncbi:MAG: hypothetical protein LC800_08665 [Acidobacteria bacterium]|nr:hypothetical protein [Acidobacteriota bacterium]
MSRARKYEKSLAEKWCMRFKTTHPDGDNYDGIVTHVKRDFIVLREEDDFELDGLIVLPKRFIKGVRDGKYDRCCNEILRENSELKKLRPARWLDSCVTLPQVFAALKRRDIWPAVEIMSGEKNAGFYIGPISEVADADFSIACYDAVGNWEGIYELSYREVFRVEIESRYCKHFNAYMRARWDTDV